MARALILSLDGHEFPVQMQKVDRERLYGDVEIEAFDENGDEASLKILDADGKTLIDTGGTALATLDEDGNSVDRKKLIPITSDGEEVEPVPSSFGAPNVIHSATIDEYLSHVVKSVYILEPPEDSDLDLLENVLSGNKIYKFDFSYRGGLEYDTAFLIGSGKTVFLIIGVNTTMQFVKLNQASILDSVEEEQISGDDIDFDLL
jgi:hypothetical protein